jgi:flagellar protein FliJ
VKRADNLMRAKRFRVDDLQRRLSTLEEMRHDADRKLQDLDESVAREKQRANDSDIGRLAFPSFLRSIEARRQNLGATLKELERERSNVEVELTAAQQELKGLEFAAEQQQRRAEEIEARRVQSRIEEMDIVRHLRKHALRSA